MGGRRKKNGREAKTIRSYKRRRKSLEKKKDKRYDGCWAGTDDG